MEGEVAKKNLYEAATTGEVARFIQLLEQDPYLVGEVQFANSRNILHVATMQGQAGIVEEIITRHPQLACELDSQNSSPLHIAAAKGYVKITAMLLRISPGMRSWRDSQGMNPVHVAAMNGHVEVLEVLLRFDSFPAMERLHRGQTVLHLCVKQNDIRVLNVLVNKLGELVYARDDDGETILHLAVRCNNLEMIRNLVENKIIEKRTRNSMGKSELTILRANRTKTTNYLEIQTLLLSLSYKSLLLKALPKLTDMTMVVVTLIATMAFQASVSPPGGVWQDDTSSHRAGEAVMGSNHPKIYKHFVRANTTAFVSSLVTIFLITTQLPSGKPFFLLIVVFAAWVSLASITVSYGASVVILTPNAETKSLNPIIIAVVVVSVGMMALPEVYRYLRRLYLFRKGASSPKRENSEF